MAWGRIAGNKIREAMPRGKFDNHTAIRRGLADQRTQLALVLERARRTSPCC
ncbi:MAG: hypothetical protein ACRD2I_14380 [Vicinamibacterales bacterium]